MENLELFSIDLAGQFDNNNQGFDKIFKKIEVRKGDTIVTRKAVGETLVDISHIAGEDFKETVIKTEDIELGKIDYSGTIRRTSYQDAHKIGDDHELHEKDAELMRLVEEHIEDTLLKNLVASAQDKTIEADTFTSMLAQSMGRVKTKPGFKGADVIAIVNTEDLYTHLGGQSITTQKLFGMEYIENYFGFKQIFFTEKIEKGKAIATAVGNLYLAYVPVVSADGFGELGLQATQGGLVGFKHFPWEMSSDIITKVQFAIESFPNRGDAVVLASLVEPVVPVE